MTARQMWISLGLAALATLVCILAQGIPNLATGKPILWFPQDLYSQVELIGFVTGVVGVYLMVVESTWNYPVGLIWAVGYGWYFFQMRHFGEATTMLISAGYLVDGWIKWSRGTTADELPVTLLKKHHWVVIGITLAIVIPLLICLLTEVHGAYVYWDATTTALSLTAQYLTNRKVFQSWFFWIFANIVIIPVFIYRGWYPTAVLYSIFTVMAFVGIREWRRSLVGQPTMSPGA
ncbi:MAG: nicotinamide mononucleotide transporter [Armatimonadetes bacterium]|nr:nicotinamide mononucleotide transporter [Armatimonadota bacterium]